MPVLFGSFTLNYQVHAAQHLLAEHAAAAQHLLHEGLGHAGPRRQLQDLHDRPAGKIPHLVIRFLIKQARKPRGYTILKLRQTHLSNY